MISRGEAELISQEIIGLAERQRIAAVERDTRWLVKLHPVLLGVPALERRRIWRQATAYGYSRPRVVALRITAIALFGMGYVLHAAHGQGAALGAYAAATAITIAVPVLAILVARRRVREAWPGR